MTASFSNFLMPRGVDNPADQSRARITLFFGAFFGTFSLLIALLATWLSDGRQLGFFIGLLLGFILNIVVVIVAQTKYWRVGAALFTLFIVIVSSIALMLGPGSGLSILLCLPIIYTGLIYGVPGVAFSFLLFAIENLLFGVVRNQVGTVSIVPPQLQNIWLSVLITMILLFSASLMIVVLITEQQRLRQYSTRLFAQLRATSEVAQTTSTILELDELLRRTVDYIRDRFGFYHVQIFLVDEDRRYAELAASTGDVGQELLRRGHRLAVGSQSIIGRVTLTGEPTVALDTANDPLHRQNELLPQTRSELALPLIAGDTLIGALDVQSTRPSAYSQEDVDSLQIMATQVSIAIRNAQLFDEQRKALNENRRLFLEAETNLREIERLNQRLTGGVWDKYLRDRQQSVVGITLQENDLRPEQTWTPGLIQAYERRRPVITSQENRHVVAVPVELRGQALGAIEVEVTENLRQVDLLEMLQSVANRLALNIDNARLFEEAQKAAQQELLINSITTKMQGFSDVEDLLRSVVNELGRALDADHASIRLGMLPPEGTDHTLNGHSNGKAAT